MFHFADFFCVRSNHSLYALENDPVLETRQWSRNNEYDTYYIISSI